MSGALGFGDTDDESLVMELDGSSIKICMKCLSPQTVDCFPRMTASRDGLHRWCRACLKAYGRAWRAKNKTYYWDRYLKKRFGLPALDYDALLAAQDGVCAICGRRCKTGNRLAVDHDHATGAIRGLLCLVCNTMIGHAADDPERLRAAASYLEGR